MTVRTSPIAKQARDIRRLEAAWAVIRRNGLRSQSKTTRDEVEEFAGVAGTGLRRIQTQLRSGKFQFPPALGIPIDRGPAKSRRPIVKSPLPSRIAQRSIHDCLLRIPAIHSLVENPNSFGGVTKRDEDGRASVPAAISETIKEIEEGATYYVRSDIASFFSFIPKPTVLDIIYSHVPDSGSQTLVQKAVNVELHNMAKLRKQGFDALFPIEEIGVAQGNCLSPLLGNILLSSFDAEMSKGDFRCLRYIDDFLILGPDKSAVRNRFFEAVEYLKRFGMTAYDPQVDKTKADQGEISGGFDFLGVNLKRGLIKPAKKSRRRLIRRIGEILEDSIEAISNSKCGAISPKFGLVRTLTVVSGMLKGWAEQYSYCNERNVFQTLDREIDKKLAAYIGRYGALRTASTDLDEQRRMLGVSLLADVNAEMLQWK
ncbi:MAG: reverse transcriptase domain-containing protein [Alphaproteobacteria bacterium]